MKLYVGGAHQGQLELAARENPGAEIIDSFHERIRAVIGAGDSPDAHVDALIRACPDAVIVADEIGSGIVPMDAQDRAWREAAGRALCRIAQESESVTRVVCGIGVRIK